MRVDQVDAQDRRALGRFVRLERELLGHHPLYVAPLDVDVRKQLSGKSASSVDSELALFLLSDGKGQPVGRAVAYVNRRWQAHHGEAAGTYVFLERYVDQAAAEAHRAADHFKTLGRKMGEYMDGRPELLRLREVE